MSEAPTLVKPRVAAPRAPMPAPPVRQYSFTDFQVNNPTAPPPGDRLDAEFDRANTSISQTITWAGTSLNTDGSLRAATVGESQLTSGLFDNISSDAAAEIQPLVNQATAAAGQAVSSANEADSSALAAANQNALAQAGASDTQQDADRAEAAADAAEISATAAGNHAADASNSANHADLDAALCTDYGVLTQAWAEHMPDTIPPNILAVMDVTGDHWSSRWWANRAHEIVQEDTAEAICDLQKYWLGAYPTPPTHNNCGDPVVAGSMYFNTTDKVSQVYDGVLWHDVTQLAPGKGQEFLYLPATPTTVFTGVDYNGNLLALDTVNSQIGVYLNGVRLLPGIDYSFTSSAVAMLLGPVTTPNSVEIIALKDVTAQPPPSGVKVNTAPWVFNGVTTTFPLADNGGVTLNPAAVDCIVSINGVIQEAGGDFTVNPGTITFTTPPETDADRWMVVGLPLGQAQDASWTVYTPTVTASSGTFTTVAATGRFKRIGKAVYLQATITVTTNGTAAGFARFTLPTGVTAAAASYVLSGVITPTQISLNALIGSGLTYAQIARYDGTYPGTNGAVLSVSGVFEATT